MFHLNQSKIWVKKHKSTVFFYFTEKNHDAISFKLKKINGIIKLCTSKQHIVLRKKNKTKNTSKRGGVKEAYEQFNILFDCFIQYREIEKLFWIRSKT